MAFVPGLYLTIIDKVNAIFKARGGSLGCDVSIGNTRHTTVITHMWRRGELQTEAGHRAGVNKCPYRCFISRYNQLVSQTAVIFFGHTKARGARRRKKCYGRGVGHTRRERKKVLAVCFPGLCICDSQFAPQCVQLVVTRRSWAGH